MNFYKWLSALLLLGSIAGCNNDDAQNVSSVPDVPEQGEVTGLSVSLSASDVIPEYAQQVVVKEVLYDGTEIRPTSNISWSSSDSSVATVNDSGSVTAIGPGVATITATEKLGEQVISESVDVNVLDESITSITLSAPASQTLVNFSVPFTATAQLSNSQSLDITDQPFVTWSSSDSNVATISNNISDKGTATGVAEGEASISVISQNQGVELTASLELKVSDLSIQSINITPKASTISVGTEQEFHVSATLSNSEQIEITDQPSLIWSSSDPSIASMSKEHSNIAIGKSPGTSNISVSVNSFSDQAELSVSDDATPTTIIITPSVATIAQGTSQQYSATLYYSDSTSKDITTSENISWSVDDEQVAIVSNELETKGLVTGQSEGDTTVHVSGVIDGLSLENTAEITVNSAKIAGLTVSPESDFDVVGYDRAFTAVAQMSDGNTVDVTNEPGTTWTIDDPKIASISNSPGSKGVVTGLSIGETTVHAQNSSYTDSANLKVVESYVISWGNEESGGDDSDIQYQLTDVQTISSSKSAFAALKSDGTVISWGNPLYGGDSSTVQTQLKNIQSITSNSGAFAAIKDDGSVITWGSELSGGNSDSVSQELSDVQSIATTSTAFAAIKGNGTVITWGDQANGGDSSGVKSLLTNVKSIYATDHAFAALKTDGSVVTWGNNLSGADSSAVEEDLKDIQTIYSNNFAFAALDSTGSVITWGAEQAGGDSQSVRDQLINVNHIYSTTSAFAAVKDDKTVVTWGNNDLGGDSTSVHDQLINVNKIFSTDSAFAAVKADGTVTTWGAQESGGDSSSVQAQLVGVESISSNITSFAALKGDGSVVTWGNDELGGNSVSVQNQLANVKAIYSTDSAFAAIKADGSVVTWGSEASGGDSSSVQARLQNIEKIYSNSSAFSAVKDLD